jgi:beta-glucosidase
MAPFIIFMVGNRNNKLHPPEESFMPSIRPLLVLLASLLLLSCNCEDIYADNNAKQNLSIWTKPGNPLTENKKLSYEKEVAALLVKMTLEQKVGQMVQPQMTDITPEQVKKYHIGAVLNGGNAYAYNNKYAGVADWVKLVDEYYNASMDTSDGRLAIPITWGTDAVHGHNKVVGATIFPHNIGLGATRNPQLLRKIGEITAKEMLVTGVDWNYAPSVAVVRDDRWGRTFESYSEDPEIVVQLTGEYIEGLQGVAGNDSFMSDDHVIATAKHFIGDGGTESGIDRGDTITSEKDLFRVHAQGYLKAIESGVLSIMPSHSMWQGMRMHGHQYLLTDVLKNQLGFDGFLIGDWNSHGLVKDCTNANCPQAINAGLDMLMVVEEWKEFIRNTIKQVKNGTIPESRIDDAVTRILRAKFRAGLFEKGPPSKRKYANKTEFFGSKEHRQVARQAVRESLVLLKNNKNLLPLDPKQKILMAGDGADNIGKQAGGWTISWRGNGAKNSDFPDGESFLGAITTAVENAGGVVTFDEKGNYENKPDVAIVAFGEEPYAEWFGDIKHLSYQRLDNKDAKLLEKLQAEGIPTVALFISGRPLWVNRAINAADAFVAVWLPGSEGGGVADVLFRKPDGSINFDFTGKLSFSWPMYPSQTALNRGDKDYRPLFPYGYGLSYKDRKNIAQLELREDIPESEKDPTLHIFEGRAVIPWFMGLADPAGFSVYLGGGVERQYIKVRETDKSTQGDAIEIEWSGNGDGTLIFLNPDENQDYSYYLEQKSVMKWDVQMQEKAAAAAMLRFGRFDELDKSIDIAPGLNTLPLNQWQEYSIDLKCFHDKGVDLTRINNPFGLLSGGKLKFRMANLRILPGLAGKATLSCTP